MTLKDNTYFEQKHNEYGKNITEADFKYHEGVGLKFYGKVAGMVEDGVDYKYEMTYDKPGLWTKMLKKRCWKEGYKVDYTVITQRFTTYYTTLRVKPKSQVNFIERLWLDWRYS